MVPGLYVDNYDDDEILLQQVNGITLAYLSYTEHTNGIPTPSGAEAHVIYTNEREVLQHQISRAKELADAVVVSVHWGVEGSHSVPEAQRSLAADLAGWGADVILGTHPHVIQAVEWLTVPEENRQVLVAYSLGNFLSAQSVANNMVGLALTFEIAQQIDPGGLRSPVSIENVKVYPTVTHYGPGYTEIRDYMFRDYTEELARAHGVHSNGGQFSLEYIRNLTQEYISSEFLVLD